MPLNPPQVILPNNLLNEIKNMPDDQISFRKATYAILLGKYTSIGTHHPQVTEAIKVDLTRNIAKTLASLQDEVVFAVQKEFGVCDDWTAVNVYHSLLNTVARISARVFVGLPLCRDEEWLKATTHYTEDVVNGFKAISKYPFFIRPIVAPFIPELRALKLARRRAGKMIGPTVATIMNSTKLQESASSDGSWDDNALSPYRDDQYNLISWILRHYKADQQPNAELIGEEQLLAGFAAIHTTSITVSQAIFDLASYPQYIPELRAEINEVSAKEPDGKLRKTSMPKLRKLDSFIKESQRMHPLGIGNSPRLKGYGNKSKQLIKVVL
jgi:gliotoxin biosynthesis cytochrome P450 monooxygenase